MIIPFIDLKTQYKVLQPKIQARINQVLDHGQYIMGPEVRELEERLEGYVGAKHCITVASGTEALLISLMALSIGPGDEVITTPFTFVATAEVIVLVGATPIFVDIDPISGNIDASLIEAKISGNTKAIIPVSLFGQPANMDEINLIASKYPGITVIEDAAQSFGATYKNKKSCNLSAIGCTSFFPSKPLGCYGDGGAIFTSDDGIAQACREIRVHGQEQRYVHTRIGVGGRMDTLQCAILLAKLERFEYEVAQRQAIALRYKRLFFEMQNRNNDNSMQYLHILPDRTSVYAQFTILVDDRKKFQDRLSSHGILTSVHYPMPINEQPAYKKFCCPDCTPIASSLAKKVISLPMGPDLNEIDQRLIVKKVFEKI